MSNRPSVVIAIQARMGSSRLPGKVLADMAGRPVLRLQLDRLTPLRTMYPVVVATTDEPRDDAVVSLAADAGVDTVRGSEADVLTRFGLVLDRYDADHVVRLTGDCPLTDPTIVADVIALQLDSGSAYTSNVHPRSFPKGLDVEVLTAVALTESIAEATEPDEREHVTQFVVRRPERYPRENLSSGDDLGGLHWTIDTAEDLESVRSLLVDVADPTTVPWRDLLMR